MSLEERAEERFAAALAASGARDPRDFYRAQLKELKEHDAAAFRKGTDYYEKRLIPAVAAEEGDPLGEWLEYGRYVALLLADGSTVQIDTSGRSAPYQRPVPLDHLVLHLPTSTREPAIPIGLPPKLSAAQRASFELLVKQRVTY